MSTIRFRSFSDFTNFLNIALTKRVKFAAQAMERGINEITRSGFEYGTQLSRRQDAGEFGQLGAVLRVSLSGFRPEIMKISVRTYSEALTALVTGGQSQAEFDAQTFRKYGIRLGGF